jgi:hypothetical protein
MQYAFPVASETVPEVRFVALAFGYGVMIAIFTAIQYHHKRRSTRVVLIVSQWMTMFEAWLFAAGLTEAGKNYVSELRSVHTNDVILCMCACMCLARSYEYTRGGAGPSMLLLSCSRTFKPALD